MARSSLCRSGERTYPVPALIIYRMDNSRQFWSAARDDSSSVLGMSATRFHTGRLRNSLAGALL
jgi:hypothetical protein